MRTIKGQISAFIFTLMGTIYFFISVIFVNIPKPIFSIILLFLSLIYLIGFKTIDFKKFSPKKISVFAVIIAIILFSTPTVLGSDVTNYILGARTAFLGGYNPYVTPYTEFKSDLIYDSFKDYIWAEVSYTYSPLLLYISGLFLFLSGGDFLINTWLFKLLFLMTFILSVYTLNKITQNPKIIYLFSLNPIILNELVKEAHIESLLIFILFMGLYFFKIKKFLLSFFAFVSLIFIKIYFIIFLPLYFVFFAKAKKRQIKPLVLMIIFFIFLFVFLYFPFWKGINTFSGILKLVMNGSQVLISFNFLSVLLMPIFQIFYKNPYENYFYSGHVLLVTGSFLVTAFYILNIFKSKKRLSDFIRSLNITYLLFLFLMVNWYFPHYSTVSIALFALLSLWDIRKYSRGLFFLTFYSSFYYLILK